MVFLDQGYMFMFLAAYLIHSLKKNKKNTDRITSMVAVALKDNIAATASVFQAIDRQSLTGTFPTFVKHESFTHPNI